ncbi:MAG: TraB/GumN family protein [Thermoplasmata archaeon]|nr:TraB/GumN family protein [Thermoplasmata archaeon]
MDKRIVIVGVGHVLDIGKKIREIIDAEKPDIIALELDIKRLNALINKERMRGGDKIYRFLSIIQNIMAKKFGNDAGNEMIAAYKKAEELMIPIACIDMDSIYVINKIWQEMDFKEKIILFLSLLTSLLIPKRKIEKELSSMNAQNFIEELEKQFPKMKKILIDERNDYMARNIFKLLEKYDKILVIIGEGHVNGILELLNYAAASENIKIYHLRDLL